MVKPLSSFGPANGGFTVGNTGPGFEPMMANSALFVCNSHCYPLELRPKFAMLAMRVISAWSILDSYVARSLAAMVGGSSEVAMAMYNALGSTATQQAALRAAGRQVLREPQMLMLEALVMRYNNLQKHRNRVAHHLWGISSLAPDGVILINPKDLDQITADPANIKWDKISVYDVGDFEAWISDIEFLCDWFHNFWFMVGPHAGQSDSLLQTLKREPVLQKLLQKLQPNSPPAPNARPPSPPPTEAPKS